MKCKDPTLCYFDGVKKQYRSWSLATPIFKIKAQTVFNCGKCLSCRKRNSAELAHRCVLHASLYKQNCFLTLTYDEKKDGYQNRLQYSDIQLFKKRLRSHCYREDRRRIQIFNVHEYGTNGKKHWHLVVFNYDFEDKKLFTVKNGNNLYVSKLLERHWPHGLHTIGQVTEASAMYQAQYTQKDIKNGNCHNDKKAKSNHSGIGREYFLRNYEQILRLGYIPINGRKIPIPRYFQKIADKHYSHFYQPENFVDTPFRKKRHNPFKNLDEPNKYLADLYKIYYKQRQQYIDEISKKWEEDIEDYIFSKDKPDFVKSVENKEYDLNNKIQHEKF